MDFLDGWCPKWCDIQVWELKSSLTWVTLETFICPQVCHMNDEMLMGRNGGWECWMWFSVDNGIVGKYTGVHGSSFHGLAKMHCMILFPCEIFASKAYFRCNEFVFELKHFIPFHIHTPLSTFSFGAFSSVLGQKAQLTSPSLIPLSSPSNCHGKMKMLFGKRFRLKDKFHIQKYPVRAW